MGRRNGTKLNKARIDTISRHVAAGNSLRVACCLSSVPSSSFHAWMKIGRELRELLEKSPDSDARLTLRERRCLELLERVEKADAEAVARNLGIIQVAARTSWQAAAWFLERTKPGEYSRKSVFTVEQSDVSSIKTPAEIAAAMDETVGAPPAQ